MQPLNFRSDASQPAFDPDEVLARVVNEYQQTRRPVTPETVFVLCNAKRRQHEETTR